MKRRVLAVTAVLLLATPAVGMVLARLGWIHPPELDAPAEVTAVPAEATPGLHAARDRWEVLDDRSELVALARAVVEAGRDKLPGAGAEWRYYALSPGGQPFSRANTVVAAEQRRSCATSDPDCVRPYALWITVERPGGDVTGSVARSVNGTDERLPLWTFTATRAEDGWRVASLEPRDG